MQTRRNIELNYGSRKSDKYVRCYKKPEVGAYRVELELHSSLLRRHNISGLDDLVRLPGVICPKHLEFVDLDWTRLHRHLANKVGVRNAHVIAGARRRATSLLRLLHYLRRNGVSNAHRLLLPRAINKDVSRALKKWIRQFNSKEKWVNTK